MYFDDVKLHTIIEIPDAVIEEEEMKAFAKRFDFIPIHTDEEYAKTTIFGGLIAPGMLSFLAIWSKYLEVDFVKKELIAGKSTKMEWHKPVYAGDVLKSTAEVTSLEKRNAKNGIVQLTVKAYNQHGDHVLTDVTELIVKCRPQ